ncbi:MAG: DUF1638 domain-containing protein [Actinobacteria bacterium]|nr:DUF1638 domain-containing protein [Actinomycetota bacterium]
MEKIKDLQNMKVKFITCDVILDEVKDRLPDNWDTVKFEKFIVIPKCDDCISLLLGSSQEYKKQILKAPGTYYLTRDYIGESENPMLSNYGEMLEKYGEKTLKWILDKMLKNYTRLVYINTGNYESDEWRKVACSQAEKLGLDFEEVEGTDQYFSKLISGQWDDQFLTVEPGQKISFEMFLTDNIKNN